MAALGIAMEIRTFKLFHKPTQLPPHQNVALNWMAEKRIAWGRVIYCLMTAALARLDPAVPLRYTICYTNNHRL